MSDLEEIKRQKYAELMRQAAMEQDAKDEIESVKKNFMFKLLTKEARERLNRVKLAHPEIGEQVELSLIQAARTGQLSGVVTDEQLKNILGQINKGKKKFRLIQWEASKQK
jgi:programmed cell death protein 5